MTLKRFEGSAPGPKGEKGETGPPGGNKGMSWPLRTTKDYGAWQFARQNAFSRAHHLQVYPFIIARRRSFTHIRYYCTLGGSRGLIPPNEHKLVAGIWADNGNGYPGALLGSSEPHTNFDAGLRETPFPEPLTLEPGPHWLGGVCTSTTSAAFMTHNREVQNDNSILYAVPGLPLSPSGAAVSYLHKEFTYDGSQPLPNPFPGDATVGGGVESVPYVITLVTSSPTSMYDDVDSGWGFDLGSNEMEFDLEKSNNVYEYDLGG